MIQTGKKGSVNGIGCLQTWQLSDAVANKRYAATCTDGGTAVTKGNRNFTGTITGLGSPPAAVFPGTESVLALIVDDGPNSIDGTALFNGLSINIAKEADDPVNWSATFGFQGIPTKGTTAIVADTFDGRYDGAGQALNPIFSAATELAAMRSATLNFNAPEKIYFDDGAAYREPGNLEGDVSIDVYDDNPFLPAIAPNTIDTLKVYVNATQFWELDWVMLTGFSNFLVDRESQALIGYTLSGMWSSRKVAAAGLGHIILPDGSTYLFGTAP